MPETVVARNEENVRPDLEKARFVILADAIRILAKASKFEEPIIGDYLEHSEYGLAFDELSDHVAANPSVLTAHQAKILEEVRRALYPDETVGDGGWHSAFLYTQAVAMMVLYECVLSKISPGDRLRVMSGYGALRDRWVASCKA